MVAIAPIEIRTCIITAYQDGQFQRELADRLDVPQSSVGGTESPSRQNCCHGNVNFHKAAHVESAIKAAKASVVFLPTYSPELNPIEPLCSKVTTFLKSKRAKSLKNFHNKFGEGLSTVAASKREG